MQFSFCYINKVQTAVAIIFHSMKKYICSQWNCMNQPKKCWHRDNIQFIVNNKLSKHIYIYLLSTYALYLMTFLLVISSRLLLYNHINIFNNHVATETNKTWTIDQEKIVRKKRKEKNRLLFFSNNEKLTAKAFSFACWNTHTQTHTCLYFVVHDLMRFECLKSWTHCHRTIYETLYNKNATHTRRKRGGRTTWKIAYI